MTLIAQLELLGQIVGAMVLGGLLGLERELCEKPSGLRTNMLVSGATAMLVGLAGALVNHFSESTLYSSELIRTDPIRVVEAVVAGISFLGAGTILQSRRGAVIGLTSAACILFSGVIGIAMALSQYALAVGGTGIAIVTLRLIGKWEHRLARSRGKRAAHPERNEAEARREERSE